MNFLNQLIHSSGRTICFATGRSARTYSRRIHLQNQFYSSMRMFSTETEDEPSKKMGFARSFELQEAVKEELNVVSLSKKGGRAEHGENVSFASLLRKSPFIGLGDFHGRIVVGKVVEILEPNLFIDYGGKFLCVCKRPRSVSNKQCLNAKVHIKLLDWELCARFLGATKDITLLESEGVVMKVFPDTKRDVPKIAV